MVLVRKNIFYMANKFCIGILRSWE